MHILGENRSHTTKAWYKIGIWLRVIATDVWTDPPKGLIPPQRDSTPEGLETSPKYPNKAGESRVGVHISSLPALQCATAKPAVLLPDFLKPVTAYIHPPEETPTRRCAQQARVCACVRAHVWVCIFVSVSVYMRTCVRLCGFVGW